MKYPLRLLNFLLLGKFPVFPKTRGNKTYSLTCDANKVQFIGLFEFQIGSIEKSMNSCGRRKSGSKM